MAIARVRIHQKITDVVQPSQTKIVDAVPESNAQSIEYHINMRKSDNTLVKSIKLLVDRTDSGARDSVWSRIGQLNINVTAQISSGYFQLQLQNNEAFDVYVSVVRQIN